MSRISADKKQIALDVLMMIMTVVWFISLIVNFRNYNITDPSEIIASLTQFISISFLLSAVSAAGSLVILLRKWPMPHTLQIFKLIVTSVAVFCFYYILAMIILSGDGMKYLWLLILPALTFAEFLQLWNILCYSLPQYIEIKLSIFMGYNISHSLDALPFHTAF